MSCNKGIAGEVSEVRRSKAKMRMDWRIPRFLDLPCENLDFFESPRFAFCDARWHLEVLPNSSSSGDVSLFLRRDDEQDDDDEDAGPSTRTVVFSVGVRGTGGGVEWRREEEGVFRKGDCWPLFGVCKISELREQKDMVMPGGALTIACVVKMPRTTGTGAGASGYLASRSRRVPLFRRLTLTRKKCTEEASSDVIRSLQESQKVALQTTVKRRPVQTTVKRRPAQTTIKRRRTQTSIKDADNGNKKTFTCFRCCVEFDARWRLVRHKKSHGGPQETAGISTNKNQPEAARREPRGDLEGERSDGRQEDEGKEIASAAEGHDQSPTEVQPGGSKSSGSKPLEKSQCGGSGVQGGGILQENAARSKRKRKQHNCPHCEYRATRSSDLRKHVNAIHLGVKPHPCPHCPYRATRSSDLQRHVSAVHLRERPHRCPHCNYSATQSGNLQRHVADTHLGESPLPCTHCEYMAAGSSDLKKHVSKYHLNLKPLQCPECDYKAVYSSKLKIHVRNVHGQPTETYRKRHFCNKKLEE